jgi:hypothetical protein
LRYRQYRLLALARPGYGGVETGGADKVEGIYLHAGTSLLVKRDYQRNHRTARAEK